MLAIRHERNPSPNAAAAMVDLGKLRDYCLNPLHEDGQHKARVFRSALGLTQADAEWLRERLLEAALRAEASVIAQSKFGSIYVVDFLLTTPAGAAVVRSGWIAAPWSNTWNATASGLC